MVMFSGPQVDELVSFPRTGLQFGLGLPNLPGGRTDARGVYNNLWGLSVTPNPRVQTAAPITTGGNTVSLFTGQGAGSWGGGGTDWGQIVGGLGQGVVNIFTLKQQNKQLKRLQRLQMGAMGLPGLGAGFGPSAAATTVPAAVPAGGGASGGGWLGGLLGTAAGILGLGPDLLPGGLEEAGTGLFGPDLFAPTRAGQRQRMIDAVNPATGERVYWRPVGRPILFTGDRQLLIRTRKTVRKMSGAAGCGVAGGRFRRRR